MCPPRPAAAPIHTRLERRVRVQRARSEPRVEEPLCGYHRRLLNILVARFVLEPVSAQRRQAVLVEERCDRHPMALPGQSHSRQTELWLSLSPIDTFCRNDGGSECLSLPCRHAALKKCAAFPRTRHHCPFWTSPCIWRISVHKVLSGVAVVLDVLSVEA